MRAKQFIPNGSNAMHESVAGPEKCWPGHRKVGTQPGTGKNAGKRVNDCEKIGEENKGLYYNVNKRKAAGTSRPASSPKAPTAQAWKDAAKTAKNEDVAEGIGQPREAGKAIQSLKNLAIMKSALTMQQLSQAGREAIVSDAINAAKTLEQTYLQNKQQGNAIFIRALRDEIDNFMRGAPINASFPEIDNASELGDLLQGKLSKVNFQQGVAEGNYDRDDYYNARRGSEYGRGLAATGYGGDGSGTRRDDIFKGQSKRLPADPFARTTGAVPKTGTGRIHSTALPGEMDEGEKIGNMDADRFDDAMARLKKLAGAGPMKTVYDPDRRVYRNMPTAVQPQKQDKK